MAIKTLLPGKISRTPTLYARLCLLWIIGWQWSCAPVETVEKGFAARQATDSGCNAPDCVAATILRSRKGLSPSPPPPVPMGLPVPVFGPQSGTVAFGTRTTLWVSSLPVGGVIEYSYDGGKIWIPGDKAPVLGTEPILSRTRINALTSNISQAAFTPYYQRMMVIGNSIMSHPPAPALGWFNNNGMAASAPNKDFVNLLTARLTEQYSKVTVRLVSGGNFERQFGQANYSIDEFNEALQQFKPDLIVIRLGENINDAEVPGPRNFEAQFRLLLDRFATYSGQPVKIVCTTSVWKRPNADAVIRKVTTQKGITLADFSSIVGQDQYFAFNQYADAGVGAHPNDAGMKRIADLIWAKLP